MRRVCSPLLVISSALPRCPGTPANLRTALLALWLAVFAPMLGATPWLVDGRPAPAAQQAVNMLAAAAAEGLQPEDYQAAWLAQAVAGAAQGPALGADAALQLEDALTTAVQPCFVLFPCKDWSNK